jgi:hypothetical protein
MIANSPVHWRADRCPAVSYKHSSSGCVRLSRDVYRTFAGNALTCHSIPALFVFWLEVLSSIDRIHKCLHAEEMTFYQAQNQLRTLTDLVINRKN